VGCDQVVDLARALVARLLPWRAGRMIDAALPEAVEAMARSLRSGATLSHALAEVGCVTPAPLGEQLGAVCVAVDAGQPLVVALDEWARSAATPSVRLVASAMALSAETGGAAARALDGVAATVRANNAVLGELRAQSSQARLSALVIALAPLAFAALALLTDRDAAGFLLGTPLGLACLLGGVALDAVAAWWMQRIALAAAP
jgi:tight adherence protein B